MGIHGGLWLRLTIWRPMCGIDLWIFPSFCALPAAATVHFGQKPNATKRCIFYFMLCYGNEDNVFMTPGRRRRKSTKRCAIFIEVRCSVPNPPILSVCCLPQIGSEFMRVLGVWVVSWISNISIHSFLQDGSPVFASRFFTIRLSGACEHVSFLFFFFFFCAFRYSYRFCSVDE